MFKKTVFLRCAIVSILFFLPILVRAQILVDCTAMDPGALPSISSALSIASPGSAIVIESGPCNENVAVEGKNNLNLGTWWGQSVTINGGISVHDSQSVYLYGLNVTNPAGNGFAIANSRNTTLNTCTSSGNSGTGLQVAGLSDVSVVSSGTFDRNGGGGINVNDNSFVIVSAWGGPIDISNNIGPGVYVARGSFTSLGNVTIVGNAAGVSSSGFGVDMRGAATAQFGLIFGPNLIQNNQGGVSLQENAEISFWSFGGGFGNFIQSNGPFGVRAGFGSQVTFYDGTQITENTGPGVDIFANSQAYFWGHNQISRNGTIADPLSAGVRVDGNSEIFMRSGEVSMNNGPGLLALVNSSADFTGVTFLGNLAGTITCDSTATMISDLANATSTPGAGVRCKTPHSLGNRLLLKTPPRIPDTSRLKAAQAKYQRLTTKH